MGWIGLFRRGWPIAALVCGLMPALALPSPANAQIERRTLQPLDVPPQPPATQQPSPQAPSYQAPANPMQPYGQPEGQSGQIYGQPPGSSGYDDYGQPLNQGNTGYTQQPNPGGNQNYGANPYEQPGAAAGQTAPGGPSYEEPAYSTPDYGDPQYSQPAYGGEEGPSYGDRQPGYYGDTSYEPQAAYGNPSEAKTPLPHDVWRGVEPQDLQQLLAGAKLPSVSPTLDDLIARALAADPPEGGQETAIKVAALERGGRAEEIVELLKPAAQSGDPGIAARYGLALLAVGRDQEACGLNLGAVPPTARPDSAVTQAAYLIPVYCAALQGNGQGAASALQNAQQHGVNSPVAKAVIGQIAQGQADRPPVPGTLTVLDYVFLRLARVALPASLAKSADPTLLYRLARDSDASPGLRLAAAERGAALNIIDGDVLRAAYEQAGPALGKDANEPYALRARLFAKLQSAPSAAYRAEAINALLSSGNDAGIAYPLARALAPQNAKLAQDPAAAKFAETGVRVAILAGDDQSAWEWIERGGASARSWPLLVAVGDPSSPQASEALNSGAEIAQQTQLPGAVLHRLITVLDGLNYDVPIPLWDMASKSPQPGDGYLPERGVLTALKEAADAGEVGKTVLLVGAALGPDGPAGANLISLGDSVRALRQVGLDAEARRLGFEALYPRWPFHGKA